MEISYILYIAIIHFFCYISTPYPYLPLHIIIISLSFGEISGETILGDVAFLVIGDIILFVYVQLMLGKFNMVETRVSSSSVGNIVHLYGNKWSCNYISLIIMMLLIMLLMFWLMILLSLLLLVLDYILDAL